MSMQLHSTVNTGPSSLANFMCSTPIVLKEQQQQFPKAMAALLKTIHLKNEVLYHHSYRTRYFSRRLSLALGLMSSEIRTIALGALLHDIGKIAVLETILNKRSKLSEQEYAIIKEHPLRGAELFGSMEGFDAIIPIVRYHHERWDGSGYPNSLSGEAIPLSARIVSIADAFEAMLSDRPYQAARTPHAAMEELYRCTGTQFDPTLVPYFCSTIKRELQSQPRSWATVSSNSSSSNGFLRT